MRRLIKTLMRKLIFFKLLPIDSQVAAWSQPRLPFIPSHLCSVNDSHLQCCRISGVGAPGSVIPSLTFEEESDAQCCADSRCALCCAAGEQCALPGGKRGDLSSCALGRGCRVRSPQLSGEVLFVLLLRTLVCITCSVYCTTGGWSSRVGWQAR